MPTLATRRACLDWPRLTVRATGQTWDGSLLVAPPLSQPQPGVRWEQRHWQPDWLVCLIVGVFCGFMLAVLALAVLLGGLALVGR